MEGFFGSFPGFNFGIIVASNHFFLGSILADIFYCIEQGGSDIFLVEGVSKFHCGSYPGQEQSFCGLDTSAQFF